jgi:uncharacterized repeat protein (TIGR01451 family)
MFEDCFWSLRVRISGLCRGFACAALLVVALALPAAAGLKTGGTYEIANDALSIAGSALLTGGTYTVISSVGREAGYIDLFQTPATFMSGYMVEGGYVSGVEAVFDVYTQSSVVAAPVGGGYLGGATDVVPGARITYTVNFSNKGEAAINYVTGATVGYANIQISTFVPAEMDYEPGTIILNAVAQTDAIDYPADACHYFSGTTQVVCIVPVTAGASGSFSFSGIVK